MAFIDIIDGRFTGLVPAHFARNGQPVNGQFARMLSRALNQIGATRGTIIPGMEIKTTSARNSASDLVLWRTKYRASQNGTVLRCVCLVLPTDTTAGSPRWYLTVDGVAQSNQSPNRRCASGAGTNLSDIFVMQQDVTVTANAQHTVTLSTDDNCRIVGWYMFELPRSSLTVGTDTMVDYTRILPLSPIYDADVASVMSVALGIWQKMRGCYVSHSEDDPATPISPTLGSETAIYESTGVVGNEVKTQYRNNYMNDVAATSTIDMYFWAYGSMSAGSGVRVVFRDEAGTLLKNVDLTGAEGYYTATATMPVAAVKTIIPYHRIVSAGGAGSIMSFGCYPLVGA